jgi:hypothetical protein
MRCLTLIFLFFLPLSILGQELYEIPYKSVTKEILKDEQFFHYEDDNRVYLCFKPNLVKSILVRTIVHGRILVSKRYSITEFSNIFEYRKIGIPLILHIVVNEYTYVIKVNPKK